MKSELLPLKEFTKSQRDVLGREGIRKRGLCYGGLGIYMGTTEASGRSEGWWETVTLMVRGIDFI